jgi:hypothetical protein
LGRAFHDRCTESDVSPAAANDNGVDKTNDPRNDGAIHANVIIGVGLTFWCWNGVTVGILEEILSFAHPQEDSK